MAGWIRDLVAGGLMWAGYMVAMGRWVPRSDVADMADALVALLDEERDRDRRSAAHPELCPTCGQPDVAVDGGPVGPANAAGWAGDLGALWDRARDAEPEEFGLVEDDDGAPLPPEAQPEPALDFDPAKAQRVARLFPSGPVRDLFRLRHDSAGRYTGPIGQGMVFEWADPVGIPGPIEITRIDLEEHDPGDTVVTWKIVHPGEWPDWPELNACTVETLRSDAWRVV